MALNIYPVTQTELAYKDYDIKINGIAATPDVARVSAVPFNRRWPGHQRQLEQTELINFLSLSTDEPLHFEITPHQPFEDVVIRPSSLGITPDIKDGVISFAIERPAYFTVEPFGRHNALHIFADPLSDYSVDANDENIIYFGKGEHDVGEINLKSNQTLFIDEGAVVYACINAIDAENISIIGRGILDNSRNKAKILFEYNAEGNDEAINNAERKHTVQLEYCTNVKIEGITIRDSLVYNIRPIGCKNMHISNVKIIGCWRFNSDGIDMHNCEDVLIENCFIRTFDDSICVKGFDCYYEGDVEKAVHEAMYRNGKAYDTFKNTTIRNCVVWNDWGKSLEIGAETRAEEICDIVFENCDVIHVTGAVLDCYNVDYADVHDITYRNINVEYDDILPAGKLQVKDSEVYSIDNPDHSPCFIAVAVAYHHEYSAGGDRRGINRNIKFQNINLLGRQQPRFLFKGHNRDHMTKDILIENLKWNGEYVTSTDKDHCIVNEFIENINFKVTRYDILDKNTVEAANQLADTEIVRFYNPNGKGKRIMFVGNSITLHGFRPQIGWYNECGMAASCPEKDYVHRIMADVNKIDSDASFCICQVAEWEVNYKDGESVHSLFEKARQFDADIIVMRFVENCRRADFDEKIFKNETQKLLEYLNPSGKAEIIFTTGFFRHPGDEVITLIAKEQNKPLVPLGDLGDSDEMRAGGLFEHKGVAHHPCDLGMKNIADRIFAVMKNIL